MIPTCCLLDAGALDGDYISEDLDQLIQDLDANACKDKRCKVMEAISGTRTITNTKINEQSNPSISNTTKSQKKQIPNKPAKTSAKRNLTAKRKQKERECSACAH